MLDLAYTWLKASIGAQVVPDSGAGHRHGGVDVHSSIAFQEHATFIEGEHRRLLEAAEQPLALTWHGDGGAAAADEQPQAAGCEHIGVLLQHLHHVLMHALAANCMGCTPLPDRLAAVCQQTLYVNCTDFFVTAVAGHAVAGQPPTAAFAHGMCRQCYDSYLAQVSQNSCAEPTLRSWCE
jgi:hypothetical protein